MLKQKGIIMKKTLYIGNDHSGISHKEAIIKHFQDRFEIVDMGCNTTDSVNYVDYGYNTASKVSVDQSGLGIVICGTGIGISIIANKVKNIRCALLYNNEVAVLAKEHNNANMLSFGAKQFSIEQVIEMIESFLKANFLGERHLERINTITKYENLN